MAVFRAWEYQHRVGRVQIININAHELDIRVVGGQIVHITGKMYLHSHNITNGTLDKSRIEAWDPSHCVEDVLLMILHLV